MKKAATKFIGRQTVIICRSLITVCSSVILRLVGRRKLRPRRRTRQQMAALIAARPVTRISATPPVIPDLIRDLLQASLRSDQSVSGKSRRAARPGIQNGIALPLSPYSRGSASSLPGLSHSILQDFHNASPVQQHKARKSLSIK